MGTVEVTSEELACLARVSIAEKIREPKRFGQVTREEAALYYASAGASASLPYRLLQDRGFIDGHPMNLTPLGREVLGLSNGNDK